MLQAASGPCPLWARSGSRRNQISGIDSSAQRARDRPSDLRNKKIQEGDSEQYRRKMFFARLRFLRSLGISPLQVSLTNALAIIQGSSVSAPHVRVGSKADMTLSIRDVRFTPESGHSSPPSRRPLWAINGLIRCSKKSLFDHLVSGGCSVCGTDKLSAFAVLRLITNSYLVGAFVLEDLWSRRACQ
jgi:hypothetical protein